MYVYHSLLNIRPNSKSTRDAVLTDILEFFDRYKISNKLLFMSFLYLN